MKPDSSDLSCTIYRCQTAYSEELYRTGKALGLHDLPDGAKRALARDLYWGHGHEEIDLMSFLWIHHDNIPEWLLWGEVEWPCRQCKAPVKLTFRDRDARDKSNLGSCVCWDCHQAEVRERMQAEEQKAKAEQVLFEAQRRAQRAAELRILPYEEYLKTEYWQQARLPILERDGYRCTLCNSTENLNVHHRTYERLGEELPEDLTTLCRACHEMFHEHSQLTRPT